MMASLFAYLYPMVTFISISGYVPQIKLLLKADRPVKDVCLNTWLLWTCSNIITLGYASSCVHDPMFCVTATVGLICTTAVSGLIIHNRYIRFGHLVPVRVASAMRHPFSRK